MLHRTCGFLVFTARRSASAVFAVVVCPSVTRRSCVETTGRIELVFGTGGFLLPVPPPHCVVRKFGYLQKLGYFPLELRLKLQLRKFRHGKSIALSTSLVVVVVDGRACWRHLYDSRRVVAVYYKSVSCNPPTPFLRFVVGYHLFLQLTRFWLTARRAVRLR